MALLTRSQLIRKGSSLQTFFSDRTYSNTNVNESIRNRYKKEKSLNDKWVFLSHKHSDVREFESTLNILKGLGLNLYLDWLDEEMPKETCGLTALKLKEKIKSCNKFILLATDNALNSKWCNWELGLGDAAKYLDNIAIFPILNDDKTWKGNEYLQIYPYIEYLNLFDEYIVKYPNGNIYNLKFWLSR